MEPEEINGDLEWEVEKIVWSEIISYERSVRGRPRTRQELHHFVKSKGYSEDENTREPPEHLGNAPELVEQFHLENPEMPRLGYVVLLGKVFLPWPSNRGRFFTLPSRVLKEINI